MHLLIIIFFILILLIIWLRIDFVCGLRMQKNKKNKRPQYTRMSNLQLLPRGDDFFKQLFADIKQATHHIHIQFYIIKDDFIGEQLQKLLIDKAKEGIKVRLLADYLGCSLKRKSIQKLEQAGIDFAFAHKPKLPFLFFTLNRRNHRKIVVIDGNIGYLGGFNVGDEYLGRDVRFGFWRDFHLRIEGDGVQDLQEQFILDWNVPTSDEIHSDIYFPPLIKGNSPIRILPTDGIFLEETFIDLIHQAKEKIYIATPYFIPGKKLLNELLNCAKRGVDVHLIVPKAPDHPLVKEASYPYFRHLLKADVNIYQYYRGFFHGKVLIIDDQMCDIGTANFDRRSFDLNHEINCLIYDKAFIQEVLTEIIYDISTSERLTYEAYKNRSLFFKGKEKFASWLEELL